MNKHVTHSNTVTHLCESSFVQQQKNKLLIGVEVHRQYLLVGSIHFLTFGLSVECVDYKKNVKYDHL